MTSNQSITLFSTKDGADKQYQIQLEEKNGGFILTGYNGRRLGTLTEQKKISVPVPYAEAKAEFDALLKKQLKKGYVPGEGGSAYTSPIDVGTPTGIDLHLLTEASEDDIERYLTDDRYCAQKKEDGQRRPVARRDAVIGGNKTGFQVPIPKVIAEVLERLARDTELDTEAVGETLRVFDVMKHAGQSVASMGCLARTKLMEQIVNLLGGNSHVVAVQTIVGTEAKRAFYQQLKAERAEGIVFKLIDAPRGIGYNDDQIKIKFLASATVQVVSHHKTRRSVEIQAFDKNGIPVSLGWVKISTKHVIPALLEIVEVEYLYCVKALVQGVYKGIRTDQTIASCVTSQLKYKAGIDADDVADFADAGNDENIKIAA